MAHEILSGKPYTYLDDAPLEERRTRAVTLRRALPESARELGALDPDAIARVRDEAWPEPRDAEEVHDALLGLVVVPREQDVGGLARCASRRCAAAGRAGRADASARTALWFAAENLRLVELLYPRGRVLDAGAAARTPRVHGRGPGGGARALLLRGQTEALGPVSAARARRARWPERRGRRPRASPARGRRLRPARALLDPAREPTRSSATGGCWRASTATRSTGCGARSTRSRRRTSCASCCAGST